MAFREDRVAKLKVMYPKVTRRAPEKKSAAVNLARAGKRATVLASTATWNVQTPDPSTELAPYCVQINQ